MVAVPVVQAWGACIDHSQDSNNMYIMHGATVANNDIHLVASPPIGSVSPANYLSNHAAGTRHIVRAAAAARVKRLICTSSIITAMSPFSAIAQPANENDWNPDPTEHNSYIHAKASRLHDSLRRT